MKLLLYLGPEEFVSSPQVQVKPLPSSFLPWAHLLHKVQIEESPGKKHLAGTKSQDGKRAENSFELTLHTPTGTHG